MRIEIVTVWYNEEFLAPFFLEYYKYVNKIHVIIDGNTTDKSEKICSKYANVQIHHWDHPDEYNVWGKTKALNSFIKWLNCDWVYSLDADEFIFPETKEDPRTFLKKQKRFNVIFVIFHEVYRHVTEGNPDPLLPVLDQRKHGDSKLRKRTDINPRIVRPGLGIKWKTACHNFEPNKKIKVSKNFFICSHWRMADVNLTIKRMVYHRKSRQCKRYCRRKKAMKVTAAGMIKAIRGKCKQHSHDPIMFWNK
jgi:hypothetical protein